MAEENGKTEIQETTGFFLSFENLYIDFCDAWWYIDHETNEVYWSHIGRKELLDCLRSKSAVRGPFGPCSDTYTEEAVIAVHRFASPLEKGYFSVAVICFSDNTLKLFPLEKELIEKI